MSEPIRDKLSHLLPHWLEHNASHADTYRQWARRAREAGLGDVADHLEQAVAEAQALGRALEAALRAMGS
ncbi:hypothetical protein [Deferrisoma camini]|uniref:hypothetical protein n=1 Tax=Deferrisoma camini TaxID=1035120 RepID=UPI00046CE4BA|nr:hypothetical protein [Deferrisoma camini]